MSFCQQPISSGSDAAEACFCLVEDPGGCVLAEAPAAYRPRHPERTGFYQLFETHFDGYVRAYEERFETRSGPMRPVVVGSVEAFLDCGRLQGGFARIRCDKCRHPAKPTSARPPLAAGMHICTGPWRRAAASLK